MIDGDMFDPDNGGIVGAIDPRSCITFSATRAELMRLRDVFTQAIESGRSGSDGRCLGYDRIVVEVREP